MKKLLRAFLLLLALVLLYLLLWPVDLNPAAWTPPEAPSLDQDPYLKNTRLEALERISVAEFGEGPEDLAIDSLGRIYVGLLNGKIVRYSPEGQAPTVFAETGGRPLGMAFDSAQQLIVADANKGLLSIDSHGNIKVLTNSYQGQAFGFADDLDIGSDGTIYFSDASDRFGVGNFREDLLEHRPHGALYAYEPGSQQTRLLADSLYFANGVALSQDESFLLVNETSKYRILRYWLKGPDQGSLEVFADNLPGFPDNVSTDAAGIFWVAFPNPRNGALDATLPYPFVRKMVYRLPEFLQPQQVRYGMVLAFDAQGEMLHNLQDPSGKLAPITSVKHHGNWLYLGSLSDDAWARIAWSD